MLNGSVIKNKHYRPEETIKPDTEKTLLLVDWSNAMYRAWFSSREQPWLAYLRFFDMLTACVHKVKQPEVPFEIIFAGESRQKLHRKIIDPNYKATRKFNENLEFQAYRRGQADLLEKIGWGLLSYPGAEADDVIASLVEKKCHICRCKTKCPDCHCADSYKTDVVIFSSDRDLCQLLAWDRVLIWRHPGIFVTKAAFEQEYGIPIKSFTAFKALVGDTSDNISGVPGWGPQRAKQAILANSIDIDLMESGQEAIDAFERALQLVELDYKLPVEPRIFERNLDLKGIQDDISLSIKRLLEELKT